MEKRKTQIRSKKSVKQMVDEYEGLIVSPPELFRDEYRLIPKPRTDRPLHIRENQNARRPPKPQRLPDRHHNNYPFKNILVNQSLIQRLRIVDLRKRSSIKLLRDIQHRIR